MSTDVIHQNQLNHHSQGTTVTRPFQFQTTVFQMSPLLPLKNYIAVRRSLLQQHELFVIKTAFVRNISCVFAYHIFERATQGCVEQDAYVCSTHTTYSTPRTRLWLIPSHARFIRRYFSSITFGDLALRLAPLVNWQWPVKKMPALVRWYCWPWMNVKRWIQPATYSKTRQVHSNPW